MTHFHHSAADLLDRNQKNKTVDLHLLASQRTSGDNFNYTYRFNSPIENVFGYRVHEVELPKGLYNVRAGNNVYPFQEGGGVVVSVSTVIGYHDDPATYGTDLATLMTAASPNGRTYTATYSTVTRKITMTVNAGTYRFRFDTTTTPGHNIIGFPLDVLTEAAAFTGTTVVNFGDPHIFVCCDDLTTNRISSNTGFINNTVPRRILTSVTGHPSGNGTNDLHGWREHHHDDHDVDRIFLDRLNDINIHLRDQFNQLVTEVSDWYLWLRIYCRPQDD